MTNAEWNQREEAFHKEMSELYRDQVLRAVQNRDAYPGGEAWKNRTRISAKLTPEAYAIFMAYCRAHGFSVNTALNTIIPAFLDSAND